MVFRLVALVRYGPSPVEIKMTLLDSVYVAQWCWRVINCKGLYMEVRCYSSKLAERDSNMMNGEDSRFQSMRYCSTSKRSQTAIDIETLRIVSRKKVWYLF